MKLIRLILVVLTLGLITLVWPAKAATQFNEDYFTEQLHKHGFSKGRTTRNFRVDLEANGYVIEVDWEKKVYEGIGQALVYAHTFNKKPGLVILDDVKKNVNFKKYIPTIKHLGIRLWVVEVNKQKGKILKVTQVTP